MLSRLQISKPSIYLCGFFLVTQLINGFNDVGNNLSETSNAWYGLAFYWALSWWFIVDSRTHGIGWIDGHLDMGLFLYLAGIFIVPYYLFKTRGWKALYTIGIFLGAFIGAYIAGAILYFLLRAF